MQCIFLYIFCIIFVLLFVLFCIRCAFGATTVLYVLHAYVLVSAYVAV